MKGNGKHIAIWILLILATVAFFIFDLLLGSVKIPFQDVISILFGGESEKESWSRIVLDFRTPKAITALMVGAGLGLSGLQMQTLFRNPLAGPFVLGISTGASLGVALLVLAGGAGILTSLGIFGNWIMVSAAILGSFLIFLIIISVSFRVKDSTSLLILGLMFSSVSGALVTILQFFSQAEQIQSYLIWTFGSLGGNSWQELFIFIPVVFFGILLTLLGIKHLNALLLGENYASSMGMNTKNVRTWIILTTCILAGTITAFCGPIAFIGLAIPHMSRLIFRSSNHAILVPATLLIGAAMMLFCDIIAQLPGSEKTLPINAVTSLIGAPFVIWLIIGRKKERPLSL